MSAATRISLGLACLLPCLACAVTRGDAHGGPGDPTTRLQLGSPEFVSQQPIPATFTCDGDDVSPALRWSQVPSEAESLVLIVDDADAGRFTHWLLYNLPPSAGDLPEGVPAARLPRGTEEGQNDWQTAGYRGPCPPAGRHQFHFRIFALDTVLTGLESPTRPQIESAMQGHVLATGELVGTYQRTGQEP